VLRVRAGSQPGLTKFISGGFDAEFNVVISVEGGASAALFVLSDKRLPLHEAAVEEVLGIDAGFEQKELVEGEVLACFEYNVVPLRKQPFARHAKVTANVQLLGLAAFKPSTWMLIAADPYTVKAHSLYFLYQYGSVLTLKPGFSISELLNMLQTALVS
jgi:hypothetical protein